MSTYGGYGDGTTDLELEYAGYGGTQPLVSGPLGPVGPAGPTWVPVQGVVVANTSATTIVPETLASVLVRLQASTTIYVTAGYVGQTLRLDLKQDVDGGRVVTFAPMIKFGSDVPTFVASAASGARDLVQLICVDGTNWALVAASHGFGV